MTRYLHERCDKALVEYRLSPDCDCQLLLAEARVLRPNGEPYSDDWFPLSEECWQCLSQSGSDIPIRLYLEHAEKFGNWEVAAKYSQALKVHGQC